MSVRNARSQVSYQRKKKNSYFRRCLFYTSFSFPMRFLVPILFSSRFDCFWIIPSLCGTTLVLNVPTHKIAKCFGYALMFIVAVYAVVFKIHSAPPSIVKCSTISSAVALRQYFESGILSVMHFAKCPMS